MDESMTPESIERFEKKFCIKSSFFCRDTQRKKMYGGSDSHMGIFTGLTGTKLYVKNLKEKIKTTKISELTLKLSSMGIALLLVDITIQKK
jgi:hypothetical protein